MGLYSFNLLTKRVLGEFLKITYCFKGESYEKKGLIAKLLIISVVSTFSLGFVGCQTSSTNAESNTAKRVVRVAHVQNENHPIQGALLELEKYIEEKTNNNIDVQIFPNELLGTQTQTIELTQTGAVDMVVAGLGALEAFNSAYTVFNLPYIMDSIEHYHAVMNDENIMGEVFNSTESSGFVGLTWFDARVRNIYTKNKVIQTPDDLKGLKIRVQTSPTNVKMLQALGASPTPMSFGEVYTGLQQGVIDGAENNELALVNNKHGEVAKVYSYNMHAMLPDILIISTSLLDRLTDEEKQIFIEAANIENEWEIKKWEQSVEEAKVTAEKMGVEFYYPDVKPFQDKMADLHAEYTQDENMKVIYDKIKAKGIEVAKAKEYEEDSVLEEREE